MKERKMSEFEKELDKLRCSTIGSGSKFFTEAMLKRHFGYWVSFESHEKIVQQVSALTIENEKLKADKQPVPKCVDDWFKCEIDGTFSAVVASYAFNDNLEAVKWVSENGGMGLLCKMYLYGYTVEKEKLYLLKHIDFCKTDKDYDWFMIKFSDGALNHLRVEKGQKPATIDCRFTQSEIDNMETGSYEQIEVD